MSEMATQENALNMSCGTSAPRMLWIYAHLPNQAALRDLWMPLWMNKQKRLLTWLSMCTLKTQPKQQLKHQHQISVKTKQRVSG